MPTFFATFETLTPKCARPNAIILIVQSCANDSPRADFQHVGEWLSLVEHLVRDQGVGGSNPLSPTNLSQVSTNIVITNLEASSSMETCARRPTLLPILNSTNIFHLSAE